MNQPEELKSDRPLKWSAGSGTDVWALFCACIAGDLETVKRLLAKDPVLVRCHFAYRKPLYFAVRENCVEIAALLLDGDPDPFGLAVNDSLLEIARDRGYADMEQLLTTKLAEQCGASPRGEPVAAAIREHDLAKLRALLDASPELLHAGDNRSNQPIHWAVMTRQIDFIDELLKRGADINARRCDGGRPIHLTSGDYHFRGWRDVPDDWPVKPREVYDHLVSRGANIDLGMACATGNLVRVRELLDQDHSLVNRPSDYSGYYTGCGAPIKNAAAGGHIEIVRLLLERGADPNLPEEGIAPDGHALHSAVVRGHIEIVRLLLKHGAHPNVEVESSADTLSAALASAGYSTQPNAEMVELLCSHGASRRVHLLAYSGDVLTAAAVFAANPALANDPEALANAASEGKGAFVRLMLRYQPDLPRRVEFPGWAVGAKTRELNELLFQHGMNANSPDWLGITPLHHFARNGDVEKAALFIEHGANLHARDEDICSTPLGWAAKFGQKPMVELLLERGADPNLPEEGIAPDGHALHSAVVNGHIEIVRLLLKHGAHANVEVESSADTLSAALASAGYSTKPNAEMVELLCSHGASRAVHLLAYSGDVLTAAAVFAANPALANDPEALSNAASEGKDAFVRLMLRYQPDLPRRVEFPGWAVGAKTRELNELLFQHGMNASAPDWLGITPLHHFARNGDVEKAALFLDHGADLHARDEDICSTPLGWAAKFGQKPMVELLLQRGAKPSLPDDPPWATPLAWARGRGHMEILKLLERHRAG